MLCFAYISNAQTLSYSDIGVLLSKDKINGTARYNSMSGAFGALGGDLSAIGINPAGAAVFIKSEFAISMDLRNTETTSNFYGTTMNVENDYSNVSQAGGIFVFETRRNSEWKNVALGFNYSRSNDFEDLWVAKGNSGFAPISDLYDNDPVVYINSDGQYFENSTEGRNDKYTFTFASQYNDNLYIGASVTTYDLEYYQNVLIEEYNNDGLDNTFDVSQRQELLTFGDAYSFNFGLISKPNDNVRLGLAYHSPVWYTLSEEFLEYDVAIFENDDTSTDLSEITGFDYKLKTPSKLTGSFAYIFDSQGLISVDYTYKKYNNIKLNNGDFAQENSSIKTDLQSTGQLRLGTEWRFDSLSLRGGYHIEKSPYKNAIDSDTIEGFSLGAGYKFRGGKLDFSYQKSTNTDSYSFYSDNNQVNAAELDINNSKFTATLVLNI